MPSRLSKKLTSLILASILTFIPLLAPYPWATSSPCRSLGRAYALHRLQRRTSDWGNIAFSNLPVISEAGSLQIPDSLATQMVYNPSRIWSENTPITRC